MKTRLLIGANEGVGVEAQHHGDGTVRYGWVHLRKGRSGVHIVRQGEAASVEELANAVDPRFPIALVILHERILLRSTKAPFRPDRDLQHWLPNAQAQEFAVHAFTVDEGSVVAVARQGMVTEFTDPLIQAGYRIVSLHLGPWVAFALRAHWRNDSTGSTFGTHRFQQGADGVWTSSLSAAEAPTITIGDGSLSAGNACAMAALWQHWFGAMENQGPAVALIPRARAEERFRLLYERASLAVVALLLVMFASDVWLRSHLAEGSAELHAALQAKAEQEVLLDSLRSGTTDRRSLLNGSGFAHSGRDMRAIDAVAASTPSIIHLTELWMAPARKALREGEAFDHRDGLLSIAGTTDDPAALPEWVGRLNALGQVGSARLLSMEREPQGPGHTFRIELELR